MSFRMKIYNKVIFRKLCLDCDSAIESMNEIDLA